MVASKFEYRHRFWFMALVYVVAYAFYNLDHLNVLYAIVSWNQGVLQKDLFVRSLYAAAALLAAVGALLLLLALGTFQSRLGLPVMLLGEALLLLRLIAHEELLLDQEYGDCFRAYRQRVPRLLPSFRPRIADDGHPPQWRLALWDQSFQWGFVATLLAFAFTLSDPVGYAFAGATLSFLVLQKLVQPVVIRLRRT
jgi:hypothetical protein